MFHQKKCIVFFLRLLQRDLKWNNRPAQLKQTLETDKEWKLPSAAITGDMREENMKKVCAACHNVNFTNAFYIQHNAELQLYSEIFAKPGEKLFNKATAVLKAIEGQDCVGFTHKIDYTWLELWHHEGRSACHGASMMASDYTQWHGNYVAGNTDQETQGTPCVSCVYSYNTFTPIRLFWENQTAHFILKMAARA